MHLFVIDSVCIFVSSVYKKKKPTTILVRVLNQKHV